MGICWYCTWGWSKEVKDIYLKGEKALGYMDMHYGPGHIVWEDENFETDHIQWCIDNAHTYRGELNDEQLALSIELLRELLGLPESVRCPRPSDYDDCNPEKFPPAVGVHMEQRG